MGNKYMSLLIIKKYLSIKLDSTEFTGIQSLIFSAFGEKYKDLLDPSQVDGLNTMLKLYTSKSTINRSDTIFYVIPQVASGSGYTTYNSYSIADKRFMETLLSLAQMSFDADEKKFDLDFIKEPLQLEDYLDLKVVITDNTNQKLASEIQYNKIQKHHLISDDSEILSNNIMVSESFNNAVTVYYPEEPVFDASDANGQIYPFTIKAFGDTRDGDTRIL